MGRKEIGSARFRYLDTVIIASRATLSLWLKPKHFRLKRTIVDNLKNVPGWKSTRKLVAFAVDDYGNVRRHSATAQLPKATNRFDALDTLETREDLAALVDTLRAVKDKHGRPAVFTPYALSGNPDFDAIEQGDFKTYHFASLPATFEKVSADQPQAYAGTWELWKKCIEEGVLYPQFHGREHLNLKLVEAKLKNKDEDILTSFRQRSAVALDDRPYQQKGWTAAFSFWDREELELHQQILEQGLKTFAAVFGYQAVAFTPPAQQFHPDLYPTIRRLGIEAIDRPFIYRQHEGRGKYSWKWESTGLDKRASLIKLVRNVVFEPNINNTDHVGKAMRQIETAFRWRKPAIISSHRVNFCGHIDPKNRAEGLASLKALLKKIVARWPDVEFVGMHDLVQLIADDYRS